MISEALLIACLMGQVPSAPIAPTVTIHHGDSEEATDHLNLDPQGQELAEVAQATVRDLALAGMSKVTLRLAIGDRETVVDLPQQGDPGAFRGDISSAVDVLHPVVGDVLVADYVSEKGGAVSDPVELTTLASILLRNFDGSLATNLVPGVRVKVQVVDLDEPLTSKMLFARVRVFENLDINVNGLVEGRAERNWISDVEGSRLVPIQIGQNRYFESKYFHVVGKGSGLYENEDLATTAAELMAVLESGSVEPLLKCKVATRMREMLDSAAIALNGGDPVGIARIDPRCTIDVVQSFVTENMPRLELFFGHMIERGFGIADLAIPNGRINMFPGFRIVVDYQDPNDPERDHATYEFVVRQPE